MSSVETPVLNPKSFAPNFFLDAAAAPSHFVVGSSPLAARAGHYRRPSRRRPGWKTTQQRRGLGLKCQKVLSAEPSLRPIQAQLSLWWRSYRLALLLVGGHLKATEGLALRARVWPRPTLLTGPDRLAQAAAAPPTLRDQRQHGRPRVRPRAAARGDRGHDSANQGPP